MGATFPDDRTCDMLLMAARTLAFGMILTAVLQAPCLAASYSIIDLGTLPGGTSSAAYGINNSGQVVGNSGTSNDGRGFLYSGGVLQPLDTLGGTSGSAWGINDGGQIIGTAGNASNQNRAALYDPSPTDLGTLASGPGNHRLPESQGLAINNLGQVVGESHVDDTTMHAFFYDGTMHDLTPQGVSYSTATAINNLSQIAGDIQTANGIHGFYYDSSLHILPTLGGNTSLAYGINDASQVVGMAYEADNMTYRAVIFSGSTPQDLGTLGGASSVAFDINNHGQIVGGADIEPGDDIYHGFLYSNGVMQDLTSLIDPKLGWVILKGTAINDQGQIVGWGTIGGATHAYLMTPIPEPSSVVLAGLGVAGFLAWGWRRRRRVAYKR